jgi:hypothetical protein
MICTMLDLRYTQVRNLINLLSFEGAYTVHLNIVTRLSFLPIPSPDSYRDELLALSLSLISHAYEPSTYYQPGHIV